KNIMNKRNLFIGVSALCDSYLQGQTLHTQPNIIYILMDDLGYGDIGCFGQGNHYEYTERQYTDATL
ncbi:hypothetical protein, partial [Bacteroides acidifaciens]